MAFWRASASKASGVDAAGEQLLAHDKADTRAQNGYSVSVK